MPVISGITRAVVQDIIDKIKQKATAPAWNQDTDSLEAIREYLETYLDGVLTTVIDNIKQKATAPAWNQDTDSLEAIREAIDGLTFALNFSSEEKSGLSTTPYVLPKGIYTLYVQGAAAGDTIFLDAYINAAWRTIRGLIVNADADMLGDVISDGTNVRIRSNSDALYALLVKVT